MSLYWEIRQSHTHVVNRDRTRYKTVDWDIDVLKKITDAVNLFC